MQHLANELYGALPLAAVGGSKAITSGAAVPSPDSGSAPAATTRAASVGDLFDDPAFWLVATIAAVIALAAASK